jgi:hypothetical protein
MTHSKLLVLPGGAFRDCRGAVSAPESVTYSGSIVISSKMNTSEQGSVGVDTEGRSSRIVQPVGEV